MDFVTVMPFTQQVFPLECLLLFQIKSQSGVTIKVLFIKKAFNIGFRSSKNEEFFCLSGISFGQHCQKRLTKSGVLEKIQKGGNGHIGGCLKGG